MCIFSARSPGVVDVAGTRIFARVDQDRQCLVYSMHLDAREPVAMVLPVPVHPGAGERALTFVDLSSYPALFDALAGLFDPAPAGFGPPPQASAVLEVHRVGSFVASWVPGVVDFGRLDPRFRLPAGVTSSLPRYDDWGFAVFQLEPGATRVHPMAFHFWTRDRARLFFPTVHAHDGTVPTHANFDHELYWQGPQEAHVTDQMSRQPVSELDAAWSRGLLAPAPVRRRTMRGYLANHDVWLDGPR